MRAVIADWRRSPFERSHKGGLSLVRPDDLASEVIRSLLRKLPINPTDIEDIIVGCAYPEGEQGYNIGRLLSFMSDLPPEVPGFTINRLCGSSMQAILSASASINSEWGDCYLCGGVESMSRIKRRGFNWSPNPTLLDDYSEAYINMGLTAENVARKYEISREDQEYFSLQSHKKAAAAMDKGYFTDEIVTISLDGVELSTDGCIRTDTSLESMSKLKPAFTEKGSVTAATSSPLTDGAVFSLVCSERFADSNSITPIAGIVTGAVTGCRPDLMGLGPISATRKAIEKAGWELDQVDVFELNEAFSSQSLACIRELGLPLEKVNIDGGALAIGHPLGASGARIVCKAASILQRTGGKRAIATMCIGGGMGMAIAIESI